MGGTKSKCLSSIASIVKFPNDDTEDISFREMYEREQGRTKLRNMVTSSKEGKIDWEKIIKTAQELHQREQQLIKKRKSKVSLSIYNKRRKEMRLRRKADSCGSFGVNLMTIPGHKNGEAMMEHSTTKGPVTKSLDTKSKDDLTKSSHKQCSPIKYRKRSSDNSISSPGASISTSTTETISAHREEWDECIFTRSWDEGMTPIFENEI